MTDTTRRYEQGNTFKVIKVSQQWTYLIHIMSQPHIAPPRPPLRGGRKRHLAEAAVLMPSIDERLRIEPNLSGHNYLPHFNKNSLLINVTLVFGAAQRRRLDTTNNRPPARRLPIQ
eukprot:9482950-Pyramimonas_sp.AAC.1